MKKVLAICCLHWILLVANAQQYPPEWYKYTSGRYIYDIQSDNNGCNTETELKDYLLNIARANLAKQIEVRVHDVAELRKESVGGRTSVIYDASTKFSTDVNLKLVETKTIYDSNTETSFAIAYIDRERARNYYENELSIIHGKVSNSLALAKNFISLSFKDKARQELEKAQKQFIYADTSLLWMNVFGVSQETLLSWQKRLIIIEHDIERMLADMEHVTKIYISCSADIFGKPYAKLQNELKGILAANGCNFVEDPSLAHWNIAINCASREYSQANTNTYFSYVDAHIIVDKIATSQRIYEDEISVKGGHTTNYVEAAKDAYAKIKTDIAQILKEYVEI